MARAKDIHWKGKVVKGFTTALADAAEHLTGWARVMMSDSVKEAILEMDSMWPHTTFVETGIRNIESSKRGANGTLQRSWRRALVGAQMFGGDRTHPWYTGQLHDSVVGAVTDNRRIVAMHYMPSHASSLQKDENGNVVNGSECALNATSAIARTMRFVPGVAASVFVTVPYAEKVNEMQRHLNYEEELAADFAASVEDYFYSKVEGFRKKIYRTK